MRRQEFSDSSSVEDRTKELDSRVITRRKLLRDGAVVAMGIAGLGTLARVVGAPAERIRAAASPASVKDTIVAAWESDMATLDPSKLIGAHELRYAMQVFETMWRLQGESSEVKPALATSWRNSRGGREWTFTLRPGVRFHDGNLLRAQDVQWNYERWMSPNHPFHDPPYGPAQYFLGALENVQAIDDRTVRFSLKRVDAAFEANMLWPFGGAIVSPEALKKLGKDKFALNPVGTGPWKVVEWNKGVRLILERNTDYWGTSPRLRRLIIKPVPEDALRLAQLKTGDVDVVTALPPQFLTDVEADPNLKLLRGVGAHVWWIALNLRERPFADKRVRQAMNYAINKETIVRDLLRGAAKVTRGPMMAGSWAEDETLKPYPYDPRKAKQLLDAAGFRAGFRTRFWVPESGSGMIAPKEIATIIQAQLKEVGVTLEIIPQEWTSYNAQLIDVGLAPKGQPTFGMGEYSWNLPVADPVLYLNPLLKTENQPPKGPNMGFYSNQAVDKLLTEAAGILDRAERKRLYVQAQKLIYEDAPWIFMFSAENLVAVRKNIQGLRVNPNPWWLDFAPVVVGG